MMSVQSHTDSTPDDAALELVLGRLEDVRPQRGYWKALCPAHPDSDPSLDIKRGTEQPVLLYCRVGCETPDVLAAIGLTLADICAPGEDKPAGEWTPAGPASDIYDYTDEDGNLLFQVCRVPPQEPGGKKQFPQRRPDPASKSGWRWKLGDTRRVLYRLPKVLAAVQAGEVIFWAEGEKDVHALERAGVTATCNPGGTAGAKWLPECAGALRDAVVIVIADRDEPGNRHARLVAASLDGIAAAVEIREAAAGKDAYDHLAAGYGTGDFIAVPGESNSSNSPVFQENRPLTRESNSSNGSNTDDGKLLAGVRNGAWLGEQEFEPLRYAVPGLITEGLSLLIGAPKIGKSWLLLDWLLAAAAGGRAVGKIEVGDARPVLYLALEDSDRRMQSRCRGLLGDGQPIPASFSYLTRITPAEVLETVRAWMRRQPATALVAIDTLGKVMPVAGMGESAYQRDYRIGGDLKKLADEHPGLAVVVAHHDRKAAADDFIDSVSGTHGLAGAADTTAVLARRRNDTAGILKITGRDVAEQELALTFADGKAWQLDGANLAAAAANARTREDTMKLGDQSGEVLKYVNSHPEGVSPGEVEKALPGRHAHQQLPRLAEAGRIDKVARGLYAPSPVISVTSVINAGQGVITDPGAVPNAGQDADNSAGQDRYNACNANNGNGPGSAPDGPPISAITGLPIKHVTNPIVVAEQEAQAKWEAEQEANPQ